MTDEPYQAPQVDAVVAELPASWPGFRRWCFLVNSAVAAILIHATAGVILVESLTSSSSSIDVIAPALLFIAGIVVYLISEWLAHMRGRRSIERLLGIANGLLAFSLVCMSIVVLWAHFALPSSDVFVDVIGILASIVVATWMGTCVWYRLRRNRLVEERQ